MTGTIDLEFRAGGKFHLADWKTNRLGGTAESFCEALGGHLAVITSAEENLVVAKLGEAIGASNIYIGLYYDWEDYEWKWVTGEPLEYTAWLDGDYGGPEYGDNNASYVRYHLPRFGNHQNYGTRWE